MSKTVMRETNEKLREFEMRDVSTKKKVPPPPPPLPFKKKKKKKKVPPPPPPSFRNRSGDEGEKTSAPPPSFSNKTEDGRKYGTLPSELSGQEMDSTFSSTSNGKMNKSGLPPPPPPKKKKFKRPKHTLFHPAAPGSDPDVVDTRMATFEVEQPRRTSWIVRM